MMGKRRRYRVAGVLQSRKEHELHGSPENESSREVCLVHGVRGNKSGWQCAAQRTEQN